MASTDELAERFRDFSTTSTHSRAPLYSRLSASIATDADLLAQLQHAPETQQLPVLLFAAVHHLLLGEPDHLLARHYPNLGGDDRGQDQEFATFRAFALDRADEVIRLVTTRGTQTNEVGRCAQFVPAFALVADELAAEHGDDVALAHVDVGTSAGLTLLLPRYAYRYDPGGAVGGPSPVELSCATRGAVPVPARLPRIAASIGLDRAPIDVLDDTEVRWLEACVWPDQADRFARLVAAIDLARLHPPDVRAGDAVADLAAIVDEAARSGHPVVTNSWVLNYLADDARSAYVAELDELGARLDLSWVIAEAPAQTPGLPVATTDPPEQITVVSLVRWRAGRRTARRLATTHPHGYWLNWEG
jgi:hypothetical protein